MITDADLRTAREQARDSGPLVLLLLLLKDYGRAVRFDEGRARFVVDGRPVGSVAMRRLLAKTELAATGRLKRLTARLLGGRMTVEGWRTAMRAEIGAAHLIMAALALGSIEAAKRSPEVLARVASEKAYVDGFAQDLKAGRVSEPKALSRAASYILAAAVTFGMMDQAAKVGAGKREAKRIRRASESCRGCRNYAGIWMPIQVMPPIGSLDCGSHCRCYLIYR